MHLTLDSPKINTVVRKLSNLGSALASNLLSEYSGKRCPPDQCLDDTLVFHTSLWAVHVDSWGQPKQKETNCYNISVKIGVIYLEIKHKPSPFIESFVGKNNQFEIQQIIRIGKFCCACFRQIKFIYICEGL
jgi:phosphomevalonate kinase